MDRKENPDGSCPFWAIPAMFWTTPTTAFVFSLFHVCWMRNSLIPFTAHSICPVGHRARAGLDRVVTVDEIILRMQHELPFNNVSQRFPEATIYRWCNSMVDYLEFLSPDDDLLDEIRASLGKVVTALRSHLLYTSRDRGRLGVLVRCRCTPTNSTVRITEAANCLWKPPVVYGGGAESLTVLAMTPQAFRSLYRRLEAVATVEIVKKSAAAPDVLRDSYTLSLSGLFSDLTGKQIQLFVNAVDAGYFDIPKRTSMERMAAKEGIGESTIQEHLSKAESKVLRALAPYLHLYGSSL